MSSKGWINSAFNPEHWLSWRDTSLVREESTSNPSLLEKCDWKQYEKKWIDVKLFEEYFKDSNKGINDMKGF